MRTGPSFVEQGEPNYSPGFFYISRIQTEVSYILHSKDDFFGETFGVINVGDKGPGGGEVFDLGPCPKNIFTPTL